MHCLRQHQTTDQIIFIFIIWISSDCDDFNILFKSQLSITGHNTHIKQSYNNKLESHSLQNYNRL
jgi:hypothetical protein